MFKVGDKVKYIGVDKDFPNNIGEVVKVYPEFFGTKAAPYDVDFHDATPAYLMFEKELELVNDN